MASGAIISVLANIPWGQVVDAAPKVADGAAKLWDAVKRKNATQVSPSEAATEAEPGPSESEILKRRVLCLEEQVISLQGQMSASTELIKALAEQNNQLVVRIEMNRAKLRRLATTAAVGAAALTGCLVYLLLRP